jgi:Adenylate and Guanylate cyclase catalytic domain
LISLILFRFFPSRNFFFKVETIGDSYLAVSGIPDPNNVHTIRMVSFACTLLQQVTNVSNELDVTLGGTAALGLRIGINSGPVTAGVLRGQKARFQLFGDTVNTASRMESTGVCNKIQISQATANLLLEQGGRSHWFEHRTERIIVKGKGEMTTYWIVPNEVVVDDTVSFSAMVPPSNIYDPEVPPSSVPLLQTNVIDSDVGTSVARRRRSNDSANGNYYDHYDSDHYQHDTNTSIVPDNINDACQLLDKEDNEQNKLFCPTRTRPVCRRKSCLA